MPPLPGEQTRSHRSAVDERSHVRVSEAAERLHQDFKWQFIAGMPKAGGFVPLDVINEWLGKKLALTA